VNPCGREGAHVDIEYRQRVEKLDSGRHPKPQQALALVAANEALKSGHIERRTSVKEQLKELNRELTARIAQSTVALTIANAHLVSDKHFRNPIGTSEMRTDIGTVTASIAHDFNNVLSIIQAYAALIVSNPTETNSVTENAEAIRATVQEGIALTRQMLAVGRKTKTKLGLADINGLLQQTIKLLSPMFPTTTVLAADLDPRVPMVMIDSGSINQAILNICLNARDAMPDGGKIIFQTRTTVGAVLRQRFPDAKGKQYVQVSVADTGVGMDAGVRSRVFESYFTTKKPDQGTGLGLSIVHGIVSEHAGFIEVSSEPGCGSSFHIYLPIPGDKVAANAVTSTRAQDEIEDRSRPRGTVLYAEDDARLSGLMQRFLEREGFEVLKAQDGAEAVEVHRRHKDLITIAILDFGLAKLNGWDAFQMMKKINPKLKGILASGYVSAEAESWLAKGELNGVLQKPYAAVDVLATIKRTIQGQ
jgi:signal transduction histidine kinase/ActR/RegA family two-component response regulator